MNNSYINVYMFELSTTKLGPGNRFALWVNGCKKSCDGCIVPRSTYTNNFVSVDDLAKLILSQDNIEGITISGGEPFLQSEAIFHLIENIKKVKDLSIIIYTGYLIEELTSKYDLKVIEHIDILIDGEYVKALDDGLSLRGSSNQRVIPISLRYKNVIDKIYGVKGRDVDIKIYKNGMQLIGVPNTMHKEYFISLKNKE